MLLNTNGKHVVIKLLGLLLLVFYTLFQPLLADDRTSQDSREILTAALKAQSQGHYRKAKKLISTQKHHPLYGYVKYRDLRRRLGRYPLAEVNSFLRDEKNSRVGKKLRKAWLIRLHKGRRWGDFLSAYKPDFNNEVEMRCRYFESKIMRGEGLTVLSEIKNTWLNGESLPKECDPAFSLLYADNNLDDKLVWSRIKMAYESKNSSLAKYLSTYIGDKRLKKLYGNWATAKRAPKRFLIKQKIKESPEGRDILTYAITRLAKSDFAAAAKFWDSISSRFSFSNQEAATIMSALGIAATKSGDPRAIKFLDQIEDKYVDRLVELHRLSAGILFKSWPEIIRWTTNSPTSDISKSRWAYWRAYALGKVGRKADSINLFKKLGKQRDYYGFLAADILNVDYQFNNIPITISAAELSRALKNSNLSRANELHLIGQKLEAKREFFYELGRSSERELEIAAKLAELWQWPKGSIFALGKASSYNDLGLRFPIDYTEIVKEELAPRNKYIVKRGDSLWKISSYFGISVTQLRRWNKLKKSAILYPGQKLLVKNKTGGVTSTTRIIHYRIKKGDSLWKISTKFGVSVQQLRDWNNIRRNKVLQIGQKLRIGKRNQGMTHYRIKKGDSLWKISTKFGVSVQQLRAWNSIRRNKVLQIGQKLRVGKRKHKKFNLSLARVLAIIRAESAFDPFARSGANARGLMQIIPSTARLTARKHSLRYRRVRDLYTPNKNIAIGTAYLEDLLNEFDGNFAMATASYNAGPHRVKRWQKKRCGDTTMWIDSIPITETRRYVRRAIFYTRVYEWRLGLPVKRIRDILGVVTPYHEKVKSKDCRL